MYFRSHSKQSTPHLCLCNCGPAAGLELDILRNILAEFGEVVRLVTPAPEKPVVYVSFDSVLSAERAFAALNKQCFPGFENRVLALRYAAYREPPQENWLTVCTTSSQLAVPGLKLILNFITEEEEQALVEGIDAGSWSPLAKRRVQHYGFEFSYKECDVERAPLGELPPWVESTLQRVHELEELCEQRVDQLTVNEYSPGVGIAPHIDTHSAFHSPLLSLSLAGHTVMEFRRGQDHRALLLPARSLLILSNEARYAWQHYIPHRKQDMLASEIVRRPPRRLSLTLRVVREGPCACSFPEHCDSQQQQRAKLPEEGMPAKSMPHTQMLSASPTLHSQGPSPGPAPSTSQPPPQDLVQHGAPAVGVLPVQHGAT
ncbi:hypothetical protein CYMTET_31030, partial [Cymbomonas tetramitiformis]